MNNLPANIEFRDLLKRMERQREETINSSHGNVLPIKKFIETIIEKARSPEHNLRFLVFDKKTSLFVDIQDHSELCKRVSQSLRDQRKRSKQVATSGQGIVTAMNILLLRFSLDVSDSKCYSSPLNGL